MKTTMYVGILWLLLTGHAWALNNESEEAALARIIHELDAIQPLVEEARSQAVDSRIRFNYSWLSQDLRKIKQGIGDYIETPSTEPRSFEPLKGDYRE